MEIICNLFCEKVTRGQKVMNFDLYLYYLAYMGLCIITDHIKVVLIHQYVSLLVYLFIISSLKSYDRSCVYYVVCNIHLCT